MGQIFIFITEIHSRGLGSLSPNFDAEEKEKANNYFHLLDKSIQNLYYTVKVLHIRAQNVKSAEIMQKLVQQGNLIDIIA